MNLATLSALILTPFTRIWDRLSFHVLTGIAWKIQEFVWTASEADGNHASAPYLIPAQNDVTLVVKDHKIHSYKGSRNVFTHKKDSWEAPEK